MKTTFIKENHFTGAGLQFQVCLLRYQHGRKHSRHARRHGAGQKLKVLHLAPQAARRERATGCGLCFWNLIVHPQQHTLPTRPHFRATPSDQAFKCMNPLGHSYSNHQLWKSLVKCCDRILKNNDKEKKKSVHYRHNLTCNTFTICTGEGSNPTDSHITSKHYTMELHPTPTPKIFV